MKKRAFAGLVTLAAVAFSSPSAFAYGESDANGFPNWSERVLLEWTNRARCDPQADLTNCTSCGDKSCYSPVPPYAYSANLNHSSRFHSAENIKQSYSCLDHYSHCAVVSNIASIYPSTCDGSASCACTGGADNCSTCPCTADTAAPTRVGYFGTAMMFEGISSYDDPDSAFYQWLDESYSGSSCDYDQGTGAPGTTNGHRFQLIKGVYGGQTATAAGFGVLSGSVSVVDEGVESTVKKLPSGSHYPRQSGSVDMWANWADSAGPKSALVNVDGECTALHLARGIVTNGAYTTNLTTVAAGCHRYFFVFTDSASNVVTFPETGSLGIGPEGSCADWDNTRPATGASCNCTPQCSGKQCGDDGCGGACGNCTGGDTCNSSGQCVGGTTGGDGGTASRDGGGGTGGDGGGGAGGDGGTANGDSPSSDSGCGCSIVGRSSGNDALLAIFALSGVLAIARRRR